MPKGIVIYSSWYGNTEKAARAICDGIKDAGLDVECKNIKDVKPKDVALYDFILFGSPTHADNIPDEMKKFMEGLKKLNLKGKGGAAFDTRYEGREIGGLIVLENYLKKFGMKIIQLGLPVLLPSYAAKGPLKEGELSKCKEFGKSFARKIKS